MKLTLLRENLIDKLTLAAKFCSSRLSSISSLQGVLLKSEKNLIHIFSTNLNQFFYTSLKTEEETTFKIIIEPKKIIEFLSLLLPGKITVSIKDSIIIFEQGKAKGSFPLIKEEDFPIPPPLKEKKEKISSQFLLKNLPLVIFTAAKDETRPVLSGTNFIGEGDELSIVATDGFRLSLIKTKKTVDFPPMIVPAEFLGEVLRQIGEEKEMLFSFLPEEKMVVFETNDNRFYSRLIEGEFPPYEKVIPQEKKTSVVVDREELLRNIKLVSVFAREFSNIIICQFTKEELKITPKVQGGEDNRVSQETEHKGEEQKVAFNYKFIVEFLNNVGGKNIIIEILRPDAPIIFKQEKEAGFLHIIMPVRIQE